MEANRCFWRSQTGEGGVAKLPSRPSRQRTPNPILEPSRTIFPERNWIRVRSKMDREPLRNYIPGEELVPKRTWFPNPRDPPGPKSFKIIKNRWFSSKIDDFHRKSMILIDFWTILSEGLTRNRIQRSRSEVQGPEPIRRVQIGKPRGPDSKIQVLGIDFASEIIVERRNRSSKTPDPEFHHHQKFNSLPDL